ncbi:short chain dehydrogenase domain-containing protein [Sarocladium implicatum]|nr:short chain dehydrogenase domain-containing protein [Sarocladium implicatum]
MKQKAVLITGCSPDGLGTALVHAYLSRGYSVFAAVRNPAKATHLKELSGVQVVIIDVTSQESIRNAREKIEQMIDGKLDVLVNNAAALGDVVPLLDVSIERSRAAFEVNVWGTLAMCQAFAPLLVKAKGTICNINSCVTDVVFVWGAIYGSSKSAARVMSETLRLQMEPLGVTVITAVMGGMATAQNDPPNRPVLELPQDSYYSSIYPDIKRHQRAENFPTKQNVDVAARNLVNDIEKGVAIPRRGEGSSMCWYGSILLPRSTFVAMVNKDSGLEKLRRPE